LSSKLISAASFFELTEALQDQTVDLLILDLNLGDSNGLDSIAKIRNTYSNLPILILSAYPEEVYAIRAFKAGAMGYLNKTIISDELIKAIRSIQSGKRYISKNLEAQLPFGLSLEEESQDVISLLSKRELEVLTLISEGLTFQEVSQKLSLSPKTISTYRTRILEKLHLENSAQLLQFAYEFRKHS
jgi:DNA-binding NarL/FixJ family response regulator